MVSKNMLTSVHRGQHIPVRRLLLPVQRLLQNELRELVPVALGLNIQVEVVIRAHVRVERALQREAGPRSGALGDLYRDVSLREAGRVVVNVHHLDLHAEQLQRVLQEHLHVELAARALLTDQLPVDFFINEQDSILKIYLQVRCPGVGHHLEAARGQFGKVQSQVLGDIPHQGAVVRLLRHRVTNLREHSIRDAQREQKHNHRRKNKSTWVKKKYDIKIIIPCSRTKCQFPSPI
uniref:Uncharacterized protein n=1 Tax=Labrus bergylta TaxID=56723 RepID=A0A3Q3GIJ3_9LABR